MAYKRVRRAYNDHGVFICDTADDIKDLPQVGHVRIGSKAFVAETSQRYLLSKSGWQLAEQEKEDDEDEHGEEGGGE